MWLDKRVAQLNIKLVVVDIVQEHVHASQIVGGVVDLLAEETFFDNMCVEMLLGLQEQGA
ncbi:hypothetical protein D3C87_1806210 [compost metagenome]